MCINGSLEINIAQFQPHEPICDRNISEIASDNNLCILLDESDQTWLDFDRDSMWFKME